MTNDVTKTCPICCETVNAAAKKCPHCQQWQSRLHTTILHPVFGFLLFGVPLLLFWVGAAVWLVRTFSAPEKRDFSPFGDQIVVLESRFSYKEEGDHPFVITVGKIKNNSPFPWDDIDLEVQYFDEEGTLIDTASNRAYTSPVLAGHEMAFAIRSNANKPRDAYDSHRVFVRSAEQPSRGLFSF